MRISIVTISYNQAPFLEQAIRSVTEQDYPDIEYIVVDPGSTDGSREIIERYRNRIDKIIFEPDAGPADGLNKGFEQATGYVLGFLNSDDYLLPGALKTVAAAFSAAPHRDVLSGHAVIVDADGQEINRFYSRRYSPTRYVYGAATLAQQSTFFKAAAFRQTNGFNIENRIAWDGELWVDLALSGAQFGRMPVFLSAFRVYGGSITGGCGQTTEAFLQYKDRMFVKVKGRQRRRGDWLVRIMNKGLEYALHPEVAMSRLLYGHTITNKGGSVK
jgi:glycosyltransferase involved in cell wall biosynthesis